MSYNTNDTMVENEKELNKDIVTRDKLIFGKYDIEKYSGGIRRFERLDLDRLNTLVEKGFADIDDRQNSAPSIGEFMEFMGKYPEYKAHGYAVEKKRSDYRVSIEGVTKNKPVKNMQEQKDFIDLFRFADDFDVSSGYCWFD